MRCLASRERGGASEASIQAERHRPTRRRCTATGSGNLQGCCERLPTLRGFGHYSERAVDAFALRGRAIRLIEQHSHGTAGRIRSHEVWEAVAADIEGQTLEAPARQIAEPDHSGV